MIGDYLNVLVLFMIVAIGYALTYKKIFSQEINHALTTLLLSITLPFMLVICITNDFTKKEFIQMLPEIVLPFLGIMVLTLLSWLTTLVFRIDKKKRGLFMNVCSMSSTIFFGIPITLAVFGGKGLPYGLIYYIAQTVIYWTVGMIILKTDINYYPDTEKQKLSLKTILTNILTPPFIAFLVGTALLLFEIKIPSFLEHFLSYLGNMTSPLAMLVVGSLLFFTDIKSLKLHKEVVLVVIFRFIIAPAVVLCLGYLLKTDAMMLKVTVIMCALPIPNTTVILVNKFKTDIQLATGALTYTTLIFLLYIPVLLWTINTFI